MSIDRLPDPVPPSPPRRRERAVEVTIAALSAVAVLVSGLGLTWAFGHRAAAPAASPHASALRLQPQAAAATGRSSAAGEEAAIAARVAPAIVDIAVTLADGGSAAGTGMVLGPGGEVLTNNHVVKGSTSIRVTIAGRTDGHPAHVVAVDPAADVALVQVEGVSGWPAVTLADSSTLTVGEPVVAIGNALGRGGAPAVTSGTITGLNRSITAGDGGGSTEDLTGMIETDASISPGDSGGALVNRAGQVVGMITAGETTGSRRRTVSVAGFAVPISAAAAIASRMLAGDTGSDIVRSSAAYLGVRVTALDAASAGRLKVSSGALVAGVVPGSPAALAGIAPGAVITRLGGSEVTAPDALGTQIRAHAPGDHVSVGWVDAAGDHTKPVALVAGPPV